LELLLGIDVGTTFCKAGAVALDGAELSHAREQTPWRQAGGHTDADPRALLHACVAAARRALAAAPGGRVVAVGVTSMAESGALLDSTGAPVAPTIAWHDPRGCDTADELLERLGGAARLTELTGLEPSPIYSLFKYRWLSDHEPGAARGVRWLSLAEWVVHALGGQAIAEPSLASRTALLDVHRGAWSQELLDLAGAPAGMMPELLAAGSPAGTVDRGLEEARGAVLAVAGHDHSCAAIGAGAVSPGDVFDSCGTAEGFVRVLKPPVAPDDVARAVRGGVSLVWHVLPRRHALLGGFESGLALQRCLDLLGVDGDGPERERLDRAALELSPAAAAMAVEDVTGERPTLAGIPHGASPAEAWRAALEAVAAMGARMLATIEAVAGPAQRLVVAGGGARGSGVLGVKRERLGPFELSGVHEPGVRGAALVAGCAAGVYPSLDELPAPALAAPDARQRQGSGPGLTPSRSHPHV